MYARKEETQTRGRWNGTHGGDEAGCATRSRAGRREDAGALCVKSCRSRRVSCVVVCVPLVARARWCVVGPAVYSLYRP